MPTTEQLYVDSLKDQRPSGPTETQAEGMRPLDAGTQGLIEAQMGRGAYNPGGYTANDHTERMEGVGKDYGLLGSSRGGDSMATATPDDFYDTMNARNRDAVADTVQKISANDKFMEPMRRAKQQAEASSNLAKSESLRFNNWTLKNAQALQKMQIQQMQDAQKKSFLSSLLGLGGAAVGGAIGFAAGGPAGAAAGAGLGMGVGGGVGGAAG